MLPNLGPQETGYWNPAVATDAAGKTTLAFTMPDRSTAWKLLAKGITAETLAGETTADVVAQKDLFGELKLPMAFTDGDEAEIVASVHNQLLDKGKINVTLKTTIGGKPYTETKTIDVTAKGITELVFKRGVQLPAEAREVRDASKLANIEVELTVAAAEKTTDVVRRTLPIQPYGLPVYAIAAGSAATDTTAWVDAPAGVAEKARTMQIVIGPSIERSLLDVLLGPAPLCQVENLRIASGLDSVTSDVMAALALQRLVKGTRDSSGPQSQALDARVRTSVGLLVAAQNDDGGWSWTGKGGPSNRYTTARVVWALSLAKAAGYAVPNDGFEKALTLLASATAALGDSDYEGKSILLHAMSVAGRGDFALANRLYRNRPALSSAALAHLALALAEMDRKPMADDLVRLLSERNLEPPGLTRRLAAGGVLPWSHGSAELRALYALALQKTAPTSPKVKEPVDWLLSQSRRPPLGARQGHRPGDARPLRLVRQKPLRRAALHARSLRQRPPRRRPRHRRDDRHAND